MKQIVLEGNLLDQLKRFPDSTFYSCVTDPPYDLIATSRNGSGRSHNPDTPAGRYGARIGGFMDLAWDATGVAFRPETWREVLRVLRPGAFLLAFGGSRTYHRMGCAIEDAGFAIRDSLDWIYGTGFAKHKAALKPAHEPIILAQKRFKGSIADNVKTWGVGALNIEASRIPRSETEKPSGWSKSGSNASENRAMKGPNSARSPKEDDSARWPANILLAHSPACLDASCGPECPIAELDRQSGPAGQQGPRLTGNEPSAASTGKVTGLRRRVGQVNSFHRDHGGASRFFYVAKPGSRERNLGEVDNIHPTVKPVDLMVYLCRLVTPAGGIVLDPFCGSGTTGLACGVLDLEFIGIDLEPAYVRIARKRIGSLEESL
jgi:site-specific DNA-methyltransferase (adenine-specific)